MMKESPVPSHADLRPKKVDSFVKKYLKRKGTTFNPVMDRRQLNVASRMLDPLGPLAHLWEFCLATERQNTGLDPTVVVDFVCRAISLVGNASFCALADRRKGLLVKVSADCLDLVDDSDLFTSGCSDLFGKRFKKAFLKELKLSKELDSLVSRNGANNNGNFRHFQPFRQRPGRGPGSNNRDGFRTWANRRTWNQTRGSFRNNFPPRVGKAASGNQAQT